MSIKSPKQPIRILQYCARCTSTMGEDLVVQNWYLFNHTSIRFDFAILFAADLNESFRQRVEADGNCFLKGILKENSILAHFSFYIKLFRLMHKNRYDAICVHESTPLFLIPCWLAKLARIKKIIILSHNSTADWLPKWIKPYHVFVFRFITNIRLAVSQKAGVALYGKNLSFQVIYNGIDTKKFAYNPGLREETLNRLSLNTHPIFGFIGRLEKEKNVSFLIDIFSAIHQKNNTARFVLLGSGGLEKYVLNKIEKAHLNSCICLLRPPQNTAPIYQALDAFILPSLYEGLPLVLLEAQTSGLPCFISDAVPQEARICNTTVIPLTYSAEAWADIILKETNTFNRTNQSHYVRQAGFDIKTQLETVEKICMTP